MCGKKKCTPYYMSHPILCGMIAGFAVIGVCGVVMAVKNKAKRLGKAAKKLGCECMESVKETTEDLIEDGMEAVDNMMERCKSSG